MAQVGVDMNVASRAWFLDWLMDESVVGVVARDIVDVRLLLCLSTDIEVLTRFDLTWVGPSPRDGSVGAVRVDVEITDG